MNPALRPPRVVNETQAEARMGGVLLHQAGLAERLSGCYN